MRLCWPQTSLSSSPHMMAVYFEHVPCVIEATSFPCWEPNLVAILCAHQNSWINNPLTFEPNVIQRLSHKCGHFWFESFLLKVEGAKFLSNLQKEIRKKSAPSPPPLMLSSSSNQLSSHLPHMTCCIQMFYENWNIFSPSVIFFVF